MATAIFDLDVSITDENMSEQITTFCQRVRPNIHRDSLVIMTLSGGITNRLMACYSKETGLDSVNTVLFRLYGKNTEEFISRADEISSMQLLKRYGLGPELYGKFKNGISYEYLPGKILNQKMAYDEKIFTKTAQACAYLHFIEFNGLITASDLLKTADKKPYIFPKTAVLLNLVKHDYQAHMPHMTDAYLRTIPTLEQLKQELAFLEGHVTSYTNTHKSPVVFSHNDLLLGNIIYNESTEVIKFIDLEYAGANYQGYDIANHFNEFAGVDEPDYSFFPTDGYQRKWIHIYLTEFYKKLNEYNKSKELPLMELDESRIDQLCVEVKKFTLASHLKWAVWSLVQAQNSQLDFNFVRYAQIRFDQYFKNKDEIVALA